MKIMPPSLASYRPRCLNDLVRLGRDADGGYVINQAAILHSRYLISLGLGNDWSFEADFRKRKPEIKILCFDHSVSRDIFRGRLSNALNEILSLRFLTLLLLGRWRAAWQRLREVKKAARLYFDFRSFCAGENVRCFQQGVSNENGPGFITLGDIFSMLQKDGIAKNSVFIKMDIEQSEFRILPDLEPFAEYVSGMAVEFHELDILWPNFAGMVNQLRDKFEVTHIHGNNWARLIPGSATPSVLEVTFLNKDLMHGQQESRARESYPIPGLDWPNDPGKPDYRLEF